MPESNAQQTCHQWLGQLGERDSFLGRHDQSLEIDSDMEELAVNLQRVEKDIGSHLNRLLEEVQADFTHSVKLIGEAQTNIQDIFLQLHKAPRNPAVNHRATRDLDKQISLLSRRVRLRMLRTLDRKIV